MFTNVLSHSSHGNISLLHLKTDPQNSVEYISGPKAIKEKFISVEEISSSGSVNELMVRNTSQHYIFFTDTDILEGAKQNRVLNTSVFLAPNSKTIIPVSCVERGRWRYASSTFQSSENPLPRDIREMKMRSVNRSFMRDESYMADQGEVWNSVASYLKVSEIDSKTENLEEALKINAERITPEIAKIKPVKGANGIAIFEGDRLRSMDIFNRNDIYTEYLPKICGGLFLEKRKKNTENDINIDKIKYELVELVDNLVKNDSPSKPGVGIGEEKRVEDRMFSGFILSHLESIIHFALTGK